MAARLYDSASIEYVLVYGHVCIDVFDSLAEASCNFGRVSLIPLLIANRKYGQTARAAQHGKCHSFNTAVVDDHHEHRA